MRFMSKIATCSLIPHLSVPGVLPRHGDLVLPGPLLILDVDASVVTRETWELIVYIVVIYNINVYIYIYIYNNGSY